MTRAVRGAIRVARNRAESIRQAAERLTRELLARNQVQPAGIVSRLFSLTPELDRANPAAAARALGLQGVPLFCLQEARIRGAMPRVLRVLLTYRDEGGRSPVPVYLDGAEALRPDLFQGPDGAA